MARPDLDANFSKINELVADIEALAPPDGGYKATKIRADLAGLLVVAISATYETCVKDVLRAHASSRHAAFGDFASRNYQKLHSRIQINDLQRYCELFSPQIRKSFDDTLSTRKRKLLLRTGQNIEACYKQILAWRHDFAHAWNRNTTIEEATKTHRAAKRILYVFEESFRNN